MSKDERDVAVKTISVLEGKFERLVKLLDIVKNYFVAKSRRLSQKDAQGKPTGKLIQPLFATMNEPSLAQVGSLMMLTCGHNGKPDDLETNNLTIHLDHAGFISI